MFPSRFLSCRTSGLLGLGLFGLLVVGQLGVAGGPPYGIPSGVMPWEYYKYFKGYQTPSGTMISRPPQPMTVTQAPKKYAVQVALVPAKHTADSVESAVVMAHVPEDASIWFGDFLTQQKGEIRYFESPPLKTGKTSFYSVRVVWYEDDEWVTQTVTVPVRAGDIRCVYIVQADQAKELAEVTANLEKLGPDDHKLAALQRLCAVQDDKPLGSLGVPVKVLVKGQPVFLCCDACVKKALSEPD